MQSYSKSFLFLNNDENGFLIGDNINFVSPYFSFNIKLTDIYTSNIHIGIISCKPSKLQNSRLNAYNL